MFDFKTRQSFEIYAWERSDIKPHTHMTFVLKGRDIRVRKISSTMCTENGATCPS